MSDEGTNGNGDRYWAGVVGENVREERRALGWSQTVLADKLREAGWNINQSMISALERNGTHNGKLKTRIVLTIDRLALVADVLGVTIAILLDEGVVENAK